MLGSRSLEGSARVYRARVGFPGAGASCSASCWDAARSPRSTTRRCSPTSRTGASASTSSRASSTRLNRAAGRRQLLLFLHYAMTGRYPATTDALPPYLAAPALPGQLALIDGPLTQYPRDPARQQRRRLLALEHLRVASTPAAVDAMFAEIVRTAAPGAVLCFRNFVGWTEVPVRWRGRVREDRARGESLFAGDRSLVNRRFAVCRIEEHDPRGGGTRHRGPRCDAGRHAVLRALGRGMPDGGRHHDVHRARGPTSSRSPVSKASAATSASPASRATRCGAVCRSPSAACGSSAGRRPPSTPLT